MITLETAEFLKSVIALVLAYVLISSFTGAFQAWVAYIMGDDTAKEYGMMSLNPFMHVDPISLILLPITYMAFRIVIGLSRPIPILWRNIQGKFRVLKLTSIALAQPLASLLLLTILMIIEILIFVFLKNSLFLTNALNVYQHIFLAVFGFSVWFLPYQLLVSLTQLYLHEKSGESYAINHQLILLLVPLVGAILLSRFSQLVLLKFLSFVESGFMVVATFFAGG